MIAAIPRTASSVVLRLRASVGGAKRGSSQSGTTTRPSVPPARTVTRQRMLAVAAARRSLTSTSSFERNRARESSGAERYRVSLPRGDCDTPPATWKGRSLAIGAARLRSGYLPTDAIYRLGVDGVDGVGVLLGLELPPGVLPVSGVVEVGGDADGGMRSRFGLSLTPP
jgi:hypothetical protein